jgi:hypothetical protein
MAKQYVRTACMDAHEFFKMVYKLFWSEYSGGIYPSM